MKQKELIEALQNTIAMQAETTKALLQMVADLKQPQITLASLPAQTFIKPLPWPPYTPYVGDPPSWPNGGWTTSPNIGIGGNDIGGTVPLSKATCSAQSSLEG